MKSYKNIIYLACIVLILAYFNKYEGGDIVILGGIIISLIFHFMIKRFIDKFLNRKK